MEKREYLVQLEIKGAEAIVQERVVFVQNDAASGRLRLLITMNSEPYPLTGLSGEIAFLRPDGQVIIGGLSFDDTGAYYDVQSSELYCAGTVNISVNLYDSTSRLTCARFPMYVEQELDTSEAVDASLAYPTILELLNSLDSLESRADTLEGRADELEDQLTAGELTGDSAYEIAVKNGFEGSESQWLASLKGADGADGADGTDGANGADGADGADGRSPYINESGQWVIYNDATGAYENTEVSAADSLKAVNVPTQSGLNVQSELDLLYSILPGTVISAADYFQTENIAAAILPGSEQTIITAYGQNLLYPSEVYVEGMPALSVNGLDPSKTAPVNSMSDSLISFTPSALSHGVAFAFKGLPEGRYYVSLTTSANVSVSIFAKTFDGTLKALNNTLGSSARPVNLYAVLDADIEIMYVSFGATTADTLNSPIEITQFQVAKSDTQPEVAALQRSVIIDTSDSAVHKSTMGAWPSWALWGKASQNAQLRLISPLSSN